MLWEELRADTFQAAIEKSGGLCVIPCGATEKHGPHLPLGTDCIIARSVARDAAELENAVVIQPFNFGHMLGYQHHPGTIALSTRLIIDYLTELCDEIGRNGFKKILLLSSHGGNGSILNVIAQATQESKKDYVVLTGNCYHRQPAELLQRLDTRGRDGFPYLTDKDIATLRSYCAQPMESGHACFCETAALMGARPDLGDLNRMNLEDGRATHRFDHLQGMGLYSPYFWAGDFPNHYAASWHPGMNERIAKALYTINVERVASIYRAIKQDEELLKINMEWNQKW